MRLTRRGEWLAAWLVPLAFLMVWGLAEAVAR